MPLNGTDLNLGQKIKKVKLKKFEFPLNSHKEKLQKEAHGKYQNLSEDEKEKSQKRLKIDRKIFLKKKKKK